MARSDASSCTDGTLKDSLSVVSQRHGQHPAARTAADGPDPVAARPRVVLGGSPVSLDVRQPRHGHGRDGTWSDVPVGGSGPPTGRRVQSR